MATKIRDISDELHRELGAPSDISPASINFWLRAHIGDLNNLINTEYTLVENEYSPEISEEAKAVLKKMYSVYYYGKQVLTHLGAAGLETIVEVESDGARVKRVNKTEVSKTFLQAKKEEEEALNKLVTAFKLNRTTPLAVHGDDAVDGRVFPNKYTLGRNTE